MAKIGTRICLSALLLMLPWAASTAQEGSDHNFNVGKNMQVFNEIYGYLDLMYVDTLDADETVGTAINSMLRSLDPYTVYYPESEVNKAAHDDYGPLRGHRFHHTLQPEALTAWSSTSRSPARRRPRRG